MKIRKIFKGERPECLPIVSGQLSIWRTTGLQAGVERRWPLASSVVSGHLGQPLSSSSSRFRCPADAQAAAGPGGRPVSPGQPDRLLLRRLRLWFDGVGWRFDIQVGLGHNLKQYLNYLCDISKCRVRFLVLFKNMFEKSIKWNISSDIWRVSSFEAVF